VAERHQCSSRCRSPFHAVSEIEIGAATIRRHRLYGRACRKRHVNMTISPTFRAGSASVSPSFFLTTPAKTLGKIRGPRTAVDPLVPRRALRNTKIETPKNH
jgi:hypothetical protein